MNEFDPAWKLPPELEDQQAAEYADDPPSRPPARRGHLEAVPTPAATTTVPHSIEVEEALLGACLLSAKACDVLASTLNPTDFYNPPHQLVAGAILHLHADGGTVDPRLVAEHLRATDLLDAAGGAPAMAALMVAAPTTSAAPHYAAIIRDHAVRRRIQLVGEEVKNLASDQAASPADIASAAQALLDTIHDANASSDDHLTHINDALAAYLDELEARQGQPVAGITTGLVDLDATLGGWQGGRLYTVAGRPGMGKSDFAVTTANAAATAGHTTLVVSVEMGREDLLDRWVAGASRIPATTIGQGHLSERDMERIMPAIAAMGAKPIWIDDNPGSTIASIRAAARRTGAQLIIVDYLQILQTAHAENRQLEVSALSRALTRMARDLDIPVIALAQLNRGVDNRMDKRPQLADLRESGSIEQESHAVVFLYRDERYHPDTTKDRGLMELIVAKNRTGPETTVKVGYLPDVKLILNIAKDA